MKLYLTPETLVEHLPTLRDLARSEAEIKQFGDTLLPAVTAHLGRDFEAALVNAKSQIGSGALPTNTLRSAGLAIKPIINGNLGEGRATKLLTGFAAHFRCLTMPVIGNLRNGSLLLDLRSLEAPEQLINQLPELCDKLGADK